MALIKCKECGKEISYSVKQCPHCGSSKHRNFFKKHPIITTLLVIAFVPQFISHAVSDLSKKEEIKTVVKKPLTTEEKQALEQRKNTELEKRKEEKAAQELKKKEDLEAKKKKGQTIFDLPLCLSGALCGDRTHSPFGVVLEATGNPVAIESIKQQLFTSLNLPTYCNKIKLS